MNQSKPVKVDYDYGRGIKGYFYIQGPTQSGRWQWDALGNSGEAQTPTEAIQSARSWIVNSVATTNREDLSK